MLYLISGAVASGKTTVTEALTARIPKLAQVEEPHATTSEERLEKLELVIEDALELESRGLDAVFAGQSPLGELLASPRAIELEGIAPCLLDAHDFVRLERWRGRGVDPAWPVGMDHFCWAVFHRLHARDPRYEQRVCVDRDYDGSVWSRWTDWPSDDPRWSVFIHDSSTETVDETVEAVAEWVASIRRDGAPLSRDAEWWS